MRAPQHCVAKFLLGLSVGIANAATAYPEYRVTIVAPANSSASDINREGVVVGTFPYTATAPHAFLNRGRGVVDLGTLGGVSSAAIAINNKGQVLGHWSAPATGQQGFIYAAGAARDIGRYPRHDTYFTDINDDGYVTAYGFGSGAPSDPPEHDEKRVTGCH